MSASAALKNAGTRKAVADRIMAKRLELGRHPFAPASIHLSRLAGVLTGASGVNVGVWRAVADDVDLDLDELVREATA